MTSARSAAPSSRRASRMWETGARAGFAVSGVIHIIVGFLIARIPFAGSGGDADQTAALTGVADAPGGAVLLWVAAGALVALALWQTADALSRGQEASDRWRAGGKAVVYAAVGASAASIALRGGSSSSGDGQAEGITTTLLGAPAGRILVGAVALGILATAGFHVYKGATRKFLEDVRAPSGAEVGKAMTVLGMVGYIAKGVALGAVGILFGYAAATADADKAAGLDGAVQSLLDLPGGPAIVVAVGVGFAAYGLYSIARARYARL